LDLHVFDFEAGALGGGREPPRAAEIEVSPIPEVGLDNPPVADQSLEASA
jgi:hypothetical protein